jgi:hypothetical protein
MVAAAIGATAVAGVAGSAMSASAASDAANAQSQAASNNLQLAQQQYNTLQTQIQPYLAAGQSGLSGYANLLGANGNDAQNDAIGSIKNGAQFQGDMQTANENILANASATGGLRGSNTNNTLANTSISTLNNLITGRLAGYQNLLNAGQSTLATSNGVSSNFQNVATSANNQTANAATSQAASLSNSFNSGLGAITQGINAYSTNNAAKQASFNPYYQSSYSSFDNPDNYG